MLSQTNEQALKACIEQALAGISLDELKEQTGSSSMAALQQSAKYRAATGHRYKPGWLADYDREFATDVEAQL